MPRVDQGNCEPCGGYVVVHMLQKNHMDQTARRDQTLEMNRPIKKIMGSLKDGRVVSGGSVGGTIGDCPRCWTVENSETLVDSRTGVSF